MQYPIKEEELEKYSNRFVTIELKNQESDIIYRLKNKNIFFLIEHQTKIDYTMPLRILEYENEIIRSALDLTKLGQKDYRFPMVISIVLYSGRKKWNVKTYISEVQEKLEGYKETEFSKYNIIDVNDYSEEELLKEKSFLSKAMLIEKTRHTNSLVIYLEKIVEEINGNKEIYTDVQEELLMTMIDLILRKKLDDEKVEELIKKLKGEDEKMLAVLEMIEEENKRLLEKGERKGEKRGIRIGIQQGSKDTIQIVVKKMLEKDIPITIIMDVTGLTEIEIMKIKEQKQ